MTDAPMTDEEIAAIRARLAESSPGNWHTGDCVSPRIVLYAHPGPDPDGSDVLYLGSVYADGPGQGRRNLRFIAHAHEDVPRLLDEIDRLRAQVRIPSDSRQAEIERWRGLAQQWRAELDITYGWIDACLPEGPSGGSMLTRIAASSVEIRRLTRERDEYRSRWLSVTGERDVTEVDDPAELPTETYCDDEGEFCESCCCPIAPGEGIAEFTENDGHGIIRRVVAHLGPCPSPSLWSIGWSYANGDRQQKRYGLLFEEAWTGAVEFRRMYPRERVPSVWLRRINPDKDQP